MTMSKPERQSSYIANESSFDFETNTCEYISQTKFIKRFYNSLHYEIEPILRKSETQKYSQTQRPQSRSSSRTSLRTSSRVSKSQTNLTTSFSDTYNISNSTSDLEKFKSPTSPTIKNVQLYYDDFTTFHNYKHFEEFDSDFDEHPEDPKRGSETFGKIVNSEFCCKLNVHKNFGRFASENDILLCHSEEYYKSVESCKFLDNRQQYEICEGKDSIYLNSFTPQVASLSVGTCLQAIEDLFSNPTYKASFCLIRPPGHHAYKHKGSGFCIYNNAAISAKYILKNSSYKRILILDWDIHHGNGTQSLTEEDTHILFISVHRSENGSFYPCKNDEMDSKSLGKGSAKGLNINVPFSKHEKDTSKVKFGDKEYFYTFENVILPIIKEFSPNFVIISAGFDAAAGDPLGKFNVSCNNGFSGMLRRIYSVLNKQTKMLLLLEGGYNLNSLSTSISSVLKFLINYHSGNNEITSSFNETLIGDVKLSCLFNLKSTIKDILTVWHKKPKVNEKFNSLLKEIDLEIDHKLQVQQRRRTKSPKKTIKVKKLDLVPCPSGKIDLNNNILETNNPSKDTDPMSDLANTLSKTLEL